MKKFYVFYDNSSGAIKAISPNYETDFAHLSHTKIPFETAIKFLNGEYTTTGWYVSSFSTVDDGVLSQEQFDFQLDSSDGLYSIPRKDYMVNMTSAINVTIIVPENTIEISIPELKNKLDTTNKPDMIFYITKRNDPSEVFTTVTVKVADLFEKKKIIVPFELKAKDCSVYTKKMFRFYQMFIQHTARRMSIFGSNVRQNNLVNFKQTKRVSKEDNSINVVHNINTGTLEININGDTSHIPYYLNSVMLMLTKHRDPTVLIDSLSYDIQQLINDGTIAIKLPKDVGDNFGIAGFPYMEHLTFTRK